jgi:hypothetical protein
MTHIINRRNAMFRLGGLGCLAVCPSLVTPLHAQTTADPQNLIILYVPGGWDITGCLDPKPGRLNIDAMPGDIARFGALDVCTHQSRPSVSEFFESHAANALIVNGIQVRSIAHEACATRLLTGTSLDTRPDLGTLHALHGGIDLPIPYFVLGNQAYSGEHETLIARAGIVGQFHRLLDPTQSYDRLTGLASSRFVPRGDEQVLIERYLNGRSARSLTSRAQRQVDAFYSAGRKGKTLGDTFTGTLEAGFQLALRSQIDLALTSLLNGATRSILLEHEVDWDSHGQNELRQTVAYDDLFTQLSYLVEQLRQANLWSRTTILVASEMSRTPQLNDGEGKDHWPVTSSLILGGSINGGRILGGTDDDLLPLPMDLSTGSIAAGGTALMPAHLINGLLRHLGVPQQPQHPSNGDAVDLG